MNSHSARSAPFSEDHEETRHLLECLFLDVKVRTPQEVPIFPLDFVCCSDP